MSNESPTGSTDSTDQPLRPDFAYRVLRRIQDGQSRRIQRRLSVASGIAALVGAMIIYLGHRGPFPPRPDNRTAVEPVVSGSFPSTDFGQMWRSDSQESVSEYFFPDLPPLAEFNEAYDPADTIDLYENGS